jgi:hypothetical protein
MIPVKLLSLLKMLKPRNLLRAALVLSVAGFLAWSHVKAYKFGGDAVRLETSKQALKQIERAQDETRSMQEKLNAAQTNYTQAKDEILSSSRRIDDLVSRLRYQAPTAEQLVIYSSPALSEYAASLERDFAECRGEYAALGVVAADASAAAHALNDGWPELTGK